MKQFSLPESTDVTVVHVSLRREKHGKNKVPAMDVRCQLTAANTIIDQLKPELRDALYTSGTPDDQLELDGGEQVTDTPLLRVHGIQPVHLDDELTGYGVVFDLGTGRKESIVEFTGVKVNSFVVEPLQGGSMKVSFRLQLVGVSKREIGEIGVLIDSLTSIRLTPPEAETELITSPPADEESPRAASKKVRSSVQ